MPEKCVIGFLWCSRMLRPTGVSLYSDSEEDLKLDNNPFLRGFLVVFLVDINRKAIFFPFLSLPVFLSCWSVPLQCRNVVLSASAFPRHKMCSQFQGFFDYGGWWRYSCASGIGNISKHPCRLKHLIFSRRCFSIHVILIICIVYFIRMVPANPMSPEWCSLIARDLCVT